MGGTSIRSSKHGRDQTIGTSRLFTISGVTMREGQGVLATPHPTRLEASVASVAARRSVPSTVAAADSLSTSVVVVSGRCPHAQDAPTNRDPAQVDYRSDQTAVRSGVCRCGGRPSRMNGGLRLSLVATDLRPDALQRPVAFRAVRDPAIRHADVSAHSMPIHRDIA